ncbi:MAG: hypothetical protein WBG32_18930 [Nodosilinea sp.]
MLDDSVGGSFIRDYDGKGTYRLSLPRIISLLLAGEDGTPDFTHSSDVIGLSRDGAANIVKGKLVRSPTPKTLDRICNALKSKAEAGEALVDPDDRQSRPIIFDVEHLRGLWYAEQAGSTTGLDLLVNQPTVVVEEILTNDVVLSIADAVILLTMIDAYRERYRVKDDPAMAVVLWEQAKDEVKLSNIEAWLGILRNQHCGPERLHDTEMLLTLCAAALRPLHRIPALGESGRFKGSNELLRYLRGEI